MDSGVELSTDSASEALDSWNRPRAIEQLRDFVEARFTVLGDDLSEE